MVQIRAKHDDHNVESNVKNWIANLEVYKQGFLSRMSKNV